MCKARVVQRKEDFNKIDIWERTYKYGVENYNEATIWSLINRCIILHKYLPCIMAHNRQLIRKSGDVDMDRQIWYSRVTEVFDFFIPEYSYIVYRDTFKYGDH